MRSKDKKYRLCNQHPSYQRGNLVRRASMKDITPPMPAKRAPAVLDQPAAAAAVIGALKRILKGPHPGEGRPRGRLRAPARAFGRVCAGDADPGPAAC